MKQADTRALFAHPSGRLIRSGDTLRNPAYAVSLRALASNGSRALHTGAIADAIVARVARGPRPGAITREDLANYTPVEREPLCRPYREYTLCVPPPPSSGVSMLQLLALLDHTEIATRGPDDPVSWYLFAEGSRLMYADRDKFVADPAFADVPVEGLLAPGYVRSRAALIGATAGPPPTAGRPAGSAAIRRGEDATLEAAGTSHFVIIDFQGNVVSMTTTIESGFGSGRVVGGFLLNNEMTDFSFSPSDSNGPIANAVATGKRPRSSMAPTIVLDRSGRVRGAFGSPGGSSILIYNSKTALGALTWKLPIQTAIDLPNLVSRGTRFTVESGRFSQRFTDLFTERGITLTPVEGEDSGLHGFLVSPTGRMEGGADSRRDGVWRVITRRAP
jgi:gamma-glutamyltranspeptidase/glutathione hydrolase